MTTAELHAKDCSDGVLQVVRAGGRVHVVAPDPGTVGRWYTLQTFVCTALAEAYIDGYEAARS